MTYTEIDSALLSRMLVNGYRNLRVNSDEIDSLNVFPVPDGDTGTNMSMTLAGGISAAEHHDGLPVGEYMKLVSRGTLLSARGNSGVILSQFIRGMMRGADGKDTLTPSDFSRAMSCGVSCAYDAVIKPVEGTMLTVMREGAEYLGEHSGDFDSIDGVFPNLINAMRDSLAHTPELLPVLKESGVIDSGGAGLVCIFEGMEMALCDQMLSDDSPAAHGILSSAAGSFDADSVLEYGYCTEFILQLQNSKTDIASFSTASMIKFLESVGSSIVAVDDGGLVKVHVHTFEPERVIEYARKFGEFVTIKIENMSVQHNEVVAKASKKRSKYAVVAVANGSGIISYLREIGATVVLDGGQTHNPSAKEFINAYDAVNADCIIVLPNNSNIVLTALQAAELYKGSSVRVIKTKSVAEGYSALSMMDLTRDSEDEVIQSMTSGLSCVTSAFVSTATRDTVMDGITVSKGDYIGLDNDRILCATKSKALAVTGLLSELESIDEKQVLTVFYGSDVTDSELVELQEALEKSFPMLECGFIDGGQDVYSYVLAVE